MTETVKRYYVGISGGIPRLVEMSEQYQRETGFLGLISGEDYASLEQECDQHRNMAGCMDLLRKDMIEAGVVGESCSPMFMTEGVLGYIGKLQAQHAAALKQVEGLRAALTSIAENSEDIGAKDCALEALDTPSPQ